MIHIRKKETIHIFIFHIYILHRTLFFINYLCSKCSKKLSLSYQSSVHTLFPKGGVVWNVVTTQVRMPLVSLQVRVTMHSKLETKPQHELIVCVQDIVSLYC